jgi:hypothetical protein
MPGVRVEEMKTAGRLKFDLVPLFNLLSLDTFLTQNNCARTPDTGRTPARAIKP